MQDIDAVTRRIDEALPDLARAVIEKYLDTRTEDTQRFLRFPDAREQHQTQWHQWGIVTHTRVFLRMYDVEVPAYLRKWNLWNESEAVLQQKIDGIDRRRLLKVSILLHDIGKFGARTHDRRGFHFARHEELSGKIIRSDLNLSQFGLTAAQIDYIAMTAEDHFVLGLVRKRARERHDYDLDFIRGGKFREIAHSIQDEHPADFVEIGVLFLGDSLSKVDLPTGPEKAVMEHDMNVAMARYYLATVLGISHDRHDNWPGRAHVVEHKQDETC